MFYRLRLILPALIPSWRFFKAIEPSHRVEWRVAAGAWREFHPRPARVSLAAMIARLFWNPAWNDALFVVSCAERIAQSGCAHSVEEIRRRVALKPGSVQFRLVFVQRVEGVLVREEVYASDIFVPYVMNP
jgi:hypothetical protein